MKKRTKTELFIFYFVAIIYICSLAFGKEDKKPKNTGEIDAVISENTVESKGQ